MPGFIDTHHHQYETILRGIIADSVLRGPKSYTSDVQGIYTPVYKPEDARRGLDRYNLAHYFEIALFHDDTDFRNPAELTKQLREKLPRRPKRVVRHHPALPYAEAPQFMVDISGATGTAASMLCFLIFTACRTNEVVEARWSEIDRPSSTWRIPDERMKMDQDHVVPLSDPALAILDKMRDGIQDELVFRNPDGGVFSENAMLAVLDRLGYSQVTVHGFRSTFATWAEECTDYPDGVREAALAHKYKSETTAAYQRGQKLEKRRALMKDWAQFLAGSNVIRLDKAG